MRSALYLAPLLGLLALPAAADQIVSQASDYQEFKQQFCSAYRGGEHIFILPAKIFSIEQVVECPDGTSTLRMAEPADDPGHTIFNIDPPHGVESAFDCDGKADSGMGLVALNCIPASAEAAGHKKT